jgi:hypothetical protein
MSAVRYPIAASAEAALNGPMGRAAREREAGAIAGADVAFATETVGPAFATREAALEAYGGRVDDERPGGASPVQPEDRYCELRELAAATPSRSKAPKPLRPVYRGGRRWPTPQPPPQTVWRLSISFWRIQPDAPAPVLGPPALAAERLRGGVLDVQALRARASEPLRPLKPQQPLDIGLFEVRPPEAPHILMPDE